MTSLFQYRKRYALRKYGQKKYVVEVVVKFQYRKRYALRKSCTLEALVSVG